MRTSIRRKEREHRRRRPAGLLSTGLMNAISKYVNRNSRITFSAFLRRPRIFTAVESYGRRVRREVRSPRSSRFVSDSIKETFRLTSIIINANGTARCHRRAAYTPSNSVNPRMSSQSGKWKNKIFPKDPIRVLQFTRSFYFFPRRWNSPKVQSSSSSSSSFVFVAVV